MQDEEHVLLDCPSADLANLRVKRHQLFRSPLGGAPLANKDSFKYLGLFYYRTHNIAKSAEHMLGPFMAGCHRIRQFAREHHLNDRPHALLWLAKCYAIPASIHACQILGRRFMKQGSEFDSPLQTAHPCFLKGVLGAKRSVPNWAVLRECGQEHLQFYWFCAAAKFFSSACGISGLLKKIVHADIALGATYRKCRTAEFIEACVGLRAADTYANCIKAATPLPGRGPLQDFVADLRERLRAAWRELDGADPRTHAQQLATYHAWMALPLKSSNVWGPPHVLHRYLELELSRHVLRNIARFHLRAHTLRVETSCWQSHNRICDKCDLHDVQDEKHLVFFVPLLGNVPFKKEIRKTIC